MTYNSTFCDPPNDDLSPLNYFEKFIDNSIIENLDQTNLYSAQKTGKSINTSVIEMCQFIGIHILAGVVQMPDGVGHWPEHLADKSRCKLCIKSYSRMKCEKCNVSLFLNKGKNCFKDFHVK